MTDAIGKEKQSQKRHSPPLPNQRRGLLFAIVVTVVALTLLDLVHLHLLSESGAAPLVWLVMLLGFLTMGAFLVPAVAALSATTAALAQWLQARRELVKLIKLIKLTKLIEIPKLTKALAVATLCLPLIGITSWALFQGQGVTRYPAVAMVGPWVSALMLSLLLIVAWLLLEWLSHRGRFVRFLSWVLFALLLIGLFLADARLFVGLYGYLHLFLSATALFVALAMARALEPERAGKGPCSRRGKLRLLATSWGIASLGLIALVVLLRLAPETRADLIERSLYTSRGIGLLGKVLPLAEELPLQARAITFEEIEESYLSGMPATSTGDRGGDRPDILLFSIDAVNADRFPGRGYNAKVMPRIAELIPGAVRFDRAYTTIPETQYALPGLIMSVTRELGPVAAVRESGDNIATALRQVGYGTYWVYEAQDLFRGGGVLNNLEFDGFDGRYGIDSDEAFASSDQIIEILEAQGDKPIFIWTHIFAPHAPYRPPQQFRIFGNSRSDLYDGELHAADAYVGRVLDYLRDQGRFERTIVIITADHGEWAGEGGRFGHGMDVRERTINIPLLFTGPGIEENLTLNQPVSILDIGPTAVELGGGVAPESFEGKSLVPALRGEDFDRGLVTSGTMGGGSTAAFLDDYKLTFNRNKTLVRLYNIATDRGGERDLVNVEPGRVQDIFARVATRDLARTVPEKVREEGADQALEFYRELVIDDGASEAERILAARSMGWIQIPETTQTLVELLERSGEDEVDPAIRQWIAHSLARTGAGAKADLALRLIENDRDPIVRVLALRSLQTTSKATDAVERWADASDVHLRRAAASLLLGPESKARPGRENSEEMLDDEDPMIRAMALTSLGHLEVTDRAAAVSRGLKDPSPKVRASAARQCAISTQNPALQSEVSCVEEVLALVSKTSELGERLGLINAVTPALRKQPSRWADLLDGPPPQRALAYEGLGKTRGEFDELLLSRLGLEEDDQASAALIRTIGERRIDRARSALIRQHGMDNFALGQTATDALLEIGLTADDVPALLEVFPRAKQAQTKNNLLHLFGTIPAIDEPRVYDLAERMRATPMKDHHLIRVLAEVYSRLTDPRAENLRVENVMYTNFGYHFWLYGYTMTPRHPGPGDEVTLKLLWSIRWQQREGTYNFIHIIGGRRTHPINRHEAAGKPIEQWPRCRIMVDELTFDVPRDAKHVKVMTGWMRGRGRLDVVYGEHDDQRRGLITEFDVASSE